MQFHTLTIPSGLFFFKFDYRSDCLELGQFMDQSHLIVAEDLARHLDLISKLTMSVLQDKQYFGT